MLVTQSRVVGLHRSENERTIFRKNPNHCATEQCKNEKGQYLIIINCADFNFTLRLRHALKIYEMISVMSVAVVQ